MSACVVCSSFLSNYKCPTCFEQYCSVQCCNKHKETKCSRKIEQSPDEVEENGYDYITDDTVPHEKLELLDNSKELKRLLDNRHLRAILTAIDTSENPEEIMQKAMLEPLFVEFADACLKTVEPPQNED